MAKERILVVDDDMIIVESIVQALEEDEFDYEVISASDGFEAGLQVNHFLPDLLILDIMMPRKDGYVLCGELKADEATRDIPVVLLMTIFSAWLMGYTIDRVSLFALIFSIGILVDDPIVDVENIIRPKKKFSLVCSGIYDCRNYLWCFE